MNELTINGFSALTEEEMMNVDGGNWVTGLCSVMGAALGIVVGIVCPPAAVAEAGVVAIVLAALGEGAACGLAGAGIGELINTAYNH